MLKKSTLSHPIYGTIKITHDTRARRIIMRARPDAIYITLPTTAGQQEIENALNKCGNKLLAQQKREEHNTIEAGYRIDAPLFKFGIELHDSNKFILKEKNGEYTLLCPESTPLDTAVKQAWLRRVIVNCMRKEATKTLPARLHKHASNHNLKYKRVTIRDSHSRWGSCSSNGTISLSLYIMLLPTKLIDYVLLHELCHTVEMNHSTRFWEKLNTLTGTNAKLLRAELRKHKTAL